MQSANRLARERSKCAAGPSLISPVSVTDVYRCVTFGTNQRALLAVDFV